MYYDDMESCDGYDNRRDWIKCLNENKIINGNIDINKVNKVMDALEEMTNNPQDYGMFFSDNTHSEIDDLFQTLTIFRKGYWKRS